MLCEWETGNAGVQPVRYNQPTMQTKGQSQLIVSFFCFQLLVKLNYICTIILYKNSYL